MGNPFIDVTTTRPAGAGRFEGDLDGSWNVRPLPQGGLVTAIAVRAMETALEHPDQRLRTLHTTYVAQVRDGPIEITTEVLRRGRSMSQVRAEVRNVGAEAGHVTTAVFGATRRGFSFTDLEPPAEIPAPADCPSYRDPLPVGVTGFDPSPFWDSRLEGRAVLGHAPWKDYEPDRAETATWYHFDEPPLQDDGRMDPLALIVLADLMPGAVGEKIGPLDEMWFAPSVDLTVHLLDECGSSWVLAHNLARYAGDGYASTDADLWDCGPDGTGTPRLVAHATQVCLFSFVPGG